MLYKLLNFNELGDARGKLVVVESNKDIPFEIKRVYYISGVEQGGIRGYHAHKKLKQFLF